MTTFMYHGPVNSGVTLRVDGNDVDVLLFRGHPVDLPENNEYVQVLMALGHLVAAETPVNTDVAAAGSTANSKKGGKQ